MKNFPYTDFPSGWFQIGWSDELSPGDARPLHYFGTDLVLMRTASGKAAVADAVCPHMGAHLGYGGKIEGESIRCPFHGWAYDVCGGGLTDVPYSNRRPRVNLRNWHTAESMGMLLVWHDAEGGAPTWDPPAWPEGSSPSYYHGPRARRLFPDVAVQPQVVIENLVDPAHQQFVHGAAQPSEFVEARPEEHVFNVTMSMVFGARNSGKKNWLTEKPTVAQMQMEAWGTGIGLNRFHDLDGAVLIHTTTPIDLDKSDMRTAMLVRKDNDKYFEDGEMTDRGARRIDHMFKQVDNDIPIWEHMTYVESPPFAGDESPTYAIFRRWSKQFYPAGRTSERTVSAGIAARAAGN